MTSIENVTGGITNDNTAGNGGANVLDGRDGNDTISGDGGADTLIGRRLQRQPERRSRNDVRIGGGGDVTATGKTTFNFARRVVITDVGASTIITIDEISTVTIRRKRSGNKYNQRPGFLAIGVGGR